jgi:hypothetical protein
VFPKRKKRGPAVGNELRTTQKLPATAIFVKRLAENFGRGFIVRKTLGAGVIIVGMVKRPASIIGGAFAVTAGGNLPRWSVSQNGPGIRIRTLRASADPNQRRLWKQNKARCTASL